jgi:glycosyltransferase involved in cell wall biosynthesis
MTRVVVVTNILSPYRVPLFNALDGENGFAVRMILLAAGESERGWSAHGRRARFSTEVLPGLHGSLPSRDFHVHVNWGLGRALRRHRPDVLIVSGYDHLAFWMALLYSRLLRKRLVLWFESSLLSAEHKAGPMAALKRFFVRRADAYVAFGTKARECLEVFGARPENIFTGINTVDMDEHREAYRAARMDTSLVTERAKYPPVLFLFVGRLIPLKNLERLIEALATLRDPDIGLLIVGGGPQEAGLKALCRRLGAIQVYFEGFRDHQDLSRYYAMSDALVLPSVKEVWGLVVNEALASGLYVLCSERAGAGHDLLQDGWNGRLFDPYSVAAIADSLRDVKARIVQIRARREEISDHACREFGIERCARAFREAVRAVAPG